MREIGKNVTNLCHHCKRPFETQKSTAKYCSGRCRAEDSRKRQNREIADGLREIEGGAAKIRGAMRSGLAAD